MIKTVMLVEDCKLTLQMTKFILTKLGVENIFVATNANEFEKLISEYITPDLIITDWNIDKNFKGNDVISAASKFGKPIAIVSSEDERKLPNAKCHWFKKPLKTDDLLAWLSKL
jgi:DNA-binding response OmpR family regulator